MFGQAHGPAQDQVEEQALGILVNSQGLHAIRYSEHKPATQSHHAFEHREQAGLEHKNPLADCLTTQP